MLGRHVTMFVMVPCASMETKVLRNLDGFFLTMTIFTGGAPNYYPNSFNGPKDMGLHDVTIFPGVRVEM